MQLLNKTRSGMLYPKDMDMIESRCAGQGSYQHTRLNKYGFTSGDIVRAVVASGKKVGAHQSRVTVRASGSFNIQTHKDVIQGISWHHCQLPSFNDGYGHAWPRHAPHSSPA